MPETKPVRPPVVKSLLCGAIALAMLLTPALLLRAQPASTTGTDGAPAATDAAAAEEGAEARGIEGVDVTEAERLAFLQKNAAAQMQELQERMFRLAEMTREAEPDDAAKLLLAVRLAREQLIIEQMKTILVLISEIDLSQATEEQRQVILKLEELKKLLLATDLDMRMQLEKLRKLGEALAKLDTAIQQEKKLQGESEKMAEGQKKGQPPADAKFGEGKKGQEKNREATDKVNQLAKELGQIGTKASQSLGEASKSMSGAEGKLGEKQAGEASDEQKKAVKKMQAAKEELEHQRKKLLEELQKQVRNQVIENLTHMLEKQRQVREATETLSPKVKEGQRESVLRLKQLAMPEESIANVAEQTVKLIEETQFSIALPPAIQQIQRQCLYVVTDLQAGRGDETVVAAEVQIEKDIELLLETIKKNNSTAKPSGEGGQCKSCGNNKNKILAELKILRLLQVRVNAETKDADGRRAAAVAELAPDVRKKIGSVKENQDQVHGAMDKLHKSICPHCIAGGDHTHAPGEGHEGEGGAEEGEAPAEGEDAAPATTASAQG